MNYFLKHYFKNNFFTTQIESNINYYYQLNQTDLIEKYNQKFLDLYRHTFLYSKFFNKLYIDFGLQLTSIKSITDIFKLPIVTKDFLRNKEDNIYAGNRFFKFKSFTSGTTGSPLSVYRTPTSINIESAYIKYFRKTKGFNYNDKLLSIRGHLDKSTLYKYDKHSNVLYISCPNLNENTVSYFYNLITSFSPKAMEGFPSYVYKLFLELSKKGLYLNIPLTFTSSEILYPFQKDKIEFYFSTKIFDWYGNVERTIGLVQDECNNYSPLPLYSINEFYDDHIITTSLTNFSFPLIRYYVDDIINVQKNNFINNLISPQVLNIFGRKGSSIKLKDGSIVGCIDHAFKGISHLQMAQIHQYGLDKPLDIKLVVDDQFSDSNKMQLEFNLRKMIGNDREFQFFFCRNEDLTYSNNEKFNLIINH